MGVQEFGLYGKHHIFETLSDKITWQDTAQPQHFKKPFVFMPYDKTNQDYFISILCVYL